MPTVHCNVSTPSLKGVCDPVDYIDREEKARKELQLKTSVTENISKGVRMELDRESAVDPRVFKKTDVVDRQLINWNGSKEDLIEAVAAAEKRVDSKHWRQVVIALPKELTTEQQIKLVKDYSEKLCATHGFAAYAVIHAPPSDNDNWHAHILTTTRKVTGEGKELGAKIRELDRPQTSGKLIEGMRDAWETTCNTHLSQANVAERIDMRTLEEQGIDRAPMPHLNQCEINALRDTKIDEGYAEKIQEIIDVHESIQFDCGEANSSRELYERIGEQYREDDEHGHVGDGSANDIDGEHGIANEDSVRQTQSNGERAEEIFRDIQFHFNAIETITRTREEQEREETERAEAERINAEKVLRSTGKRDAVRRVNSLTGLIGRAGKLVSDTVGTARNKLEALARDRASKKTMRIIDDAFGRMRSLIPKICGANGEATKRLAIAQRITGRRSEVVGTAEIVKRLREDLTGRAVGFINKIIVELGRIKTEYQTRRTDTIKNVIGQLPPKQFTREIERIAPEIIRGAIRGMDKEKVIEAIIIKGHGSRLADPKLGRPLIQQTIVVAARLTQEDKIEADTCTRLTTELKTAERTLWTPNEIAADRAAAQAAAEKERLARERERAAAEQKRREEEAAKAAETTAAARAAAIKQLQKDLIIEKGQPAEYYKAKYELFRAHQQTELGKEFKTEISAAWKEANIEAYTVEHKRREKLSPEERAKEDTQKETARIEALREKYIAEGGTEEGFQRELRRAEKLKEALCSPPTPSRERQSRGPRI